MAKETSNKGNPAHKRMGNAKLKARRAASWARGQRRKVRAALEVKAREDDNVARKALGLLTPWEEAKAKRAARRAVERENPE